MSDHEIYFFVIIGIFCIPAILLIFYAAEIGSMKNYFFGLIRIGEKSPTNAIRFIGLILFISLILILVLSLINRVDA